MLIHNADKRGAIARAAAFKAFGEEFLDAVQGLPTLKSFGQSGAFAAKLELSFQDDKHGVGRVTLAKVELFRFEVQFFRVTEEPVDLVLRQIGERRDAQQFRSFDHFIYWFALSGSRSLRSPYVLFSHHTLLKY